MTARRSRRDAGDHRDSGMTLAELVVTMGLLVLIGALLTATAVVTFRAVTTSQVRIDDAAQGQNGLAAASKVLRTAVLPTQLDNQTCTGCEATAVTVASGTQVRFYANLNNTGTGPSLVTLKVVANPQAPAYGQLVQQTQLPILLSDGSYTFCTAGSAGCVVQQRVLTRGLATPTSKVFTFYDYDGTAISSETLSTAELRRISSVDVVLTVQTRAGDSRYPARTALTRVRLPNVEINVVNTT